MHLDASLKYRLGDLLLLLLFFVGSLSGFVQVLLCAVTVAGAGSGNITFGFTVAGLTGRLLSR